MDGIIKFQGIGTHWWIKIYEEFEDEYFLKLQDQIQNSVKEFEKLYSRFINTSLVSQLNENKYLKNPSKELITLLKLGSEAKEITKGHFNISVGKVLENIGYDAQYSFKSKIVSLNEEEDFIEFK